jgi:hypothetical protein
MVNLGLHFFILLSISGYTANLAAYLTRRDVQTGFRTLEEAGILGKTICVYAPLEDYLVIDHPTVKFVPVEFRAEARTFHRGMCDAIVLSDEMGKLLHSGDVNRLDCEDMRSGKLTMEESQCNLDADGTLDGVGSAVAVQRRAKSKAKRSSGASAGGGASVPQRLQLPPDLGASRDCDLQRVGNVLHAIPFGFAMSPSVPRPLKHALSYSVSRSLAEGGLKARRDQFKSLEAIDRCGKADSFSENESQMTVSDMAGALLFSGALAVIGILITIFQKQIKYLASRGALAPKLKVSIIEEQSRTLGDLLSQISQLAEQAALLGNGSTTEEEDQATKCVMPKLPEPVLAGPELEGESPRPVQSSLELSPQIKGPYDSVQI